jgi:sterol desaturase/sphingolipid hydroxylase (fatty acid hydroxylase superfamily)
MPIYLQYYFWLFAVSAVVFALERVFAARRNQPVVRDDLPQDLFWMVFNTQFLGWMFALGTLHLTHWIDARSVQLGFPHPSALHLIGSWPWWLQAVVLFVFKDFVEWLIHRAMHLSPWLWRTHALHHSSRTLDWASTFRSHWTELVIHTVVIFLPMLCLGPDKGVVFLVAIVGLAVQELNHANLPWDFGPFRYLITSPRYHAWHHDIQMHGRGGQNFAVNLACWDWIFGSAYWPGRQHAPKALGFQGMESYPESTWGRLWAPFRREKK